MGHRDHGGKDECRVESQAPEVPVVGQKIFMGLCKEADEDQGSHSAHIYRLPELAARERDLSIHQYRSVYITKNVFTKHKHLVQPAPVS